MTYDDDRVSLGRKVGRWLVQALTAVAAFLLALAGFLYWLA
jgi:hypothetical protein